MNKRFYRLFHFFGIVIMVASMFAPFIDLEQIAAAAQEATPSSQNEATDSEPGVSLTESEQAPDAKDSDGDGLTDQEEVQLGTDVSNIDTDGDGLSDADEVGTATDPLDPNSPPPPQVTIRPLDPIETVAVCNNGTLVPPALTMNVTDGVTYRTEPLAPYTAGQTVKIIAELDVADTTSWADVLPDHWNLDPVSGDVFREFTFSPVPCEPIEAPVSEEGINEAPDGTPDGSTVDEEIPSGDVSENPESGIATPDASGVENPPAQIPNSTTDAKSNPESVATPPTDTPERENQTSNPENISATRNAFPESSDSSQIGTPIASPEAGLMMPMSLTAQQNNDCEVDFLGTVTCSDGNSDVSRFLSVIPVHDGIMYGNEGYEIRYVIRANHNSGPLSFEVRIQLPVIDQHASVSVSGDGNLQCQKVVHYGADRPRGVSINCSGALPPDGETEITVNMFPDTREDAYVRTACGLIGGTNPDGGYIQTSGIWVYPAGQSFPSSEGIYRATTAWLPCEDQPIVNLLVDRYPYDTGPGIDAGEQIGFEFTAINRGTARAENVRVQAWLPNPSGMEWTASSEYCDFISNLVICEGFALDVDEQLNVTLTSPTTPESCGWHTFTAMVSSPVVGSSDQARYTARQQVNCETGYFSITPSNSSVAPGQPVDFDLTIFNGSPIQSLDNLSMLVNTDAPDGTTWSVIDKSDFPNCAFSSGGTLPDSQLSCGMLWEGIPGLSSITVKVRATPDKYECGQIEMSGTASFRSPPFLDASTTVNADCVERPDVEQSFTVADPVIVVGEEMSFTYTFTNHTSEIRYWSVNGPELPGTDWNIRTTGPFHRGQIPYICYTTSNSFKCQTELSMSFPRGQTGTLTVSRTATTEDCGQTYGGTVGFTSLLEDKGSWVSNNATIQVLCDPVEASISGPATITSGDELQYTISLTNRMASETVAISVDDVLPETGSSWSTALSDECSIIGNLLDCDNITIGAGGTMHFRVTSYATEDLSCDGLANTAYVNGVPTNTLLTSVLCDNDGLVFSRGVAKPVIAPGDDAVFVYKLMIPEDGTGGTVMLDGDVLASENLDDWSMTITGDLAGQCSIDETYFPYARPVCESQMEPGDVGTITISRPVTTDDCGVTLGGNARATLGGNTVTRTATVKVGCTDVSFSFTGPGSGRPGEDLSYTLNFTNLGNIDATISTATVQFPDWVSISPTIDNCTINGEINLATCENLVVSPMSTLNVPIEMQVIQSQAFCGETFTMQAHYTDSMGDSGESRAFQFSVDCSPQLSIDLTVVESGSHPEIDVDHTITIQNHSLTVATDVFVTDQLPAVGSVVVTNPTSGCEVSDANLVTCSNLTVPAHDGSTPGSLKIELTYTAPDDFSLCGQFNNRAYYQIGADGTRDGSNSVISEIDCDTGLSLSLTGQAEVEPGGEAWGELRAWNLVEGERTDVSVEHTLPGNLEFVDTPEECEVTGSTLTCENLTLNSFSNVELDFTYKVPTDYACGSEITRAASMTWNTFTIHSSSITTNVVCSAELAIEIDGATTANRGDTIDYTITVNNAGTGDASGVTVVDDLPDSGTATASTEGCDVANGNVVTCAGLTIPANDGEAVIELTYSLPEDFASCRNVTNIASYQYGAEEAVFSDPVTTEVTCGTNVTIQNAAASSQIDVGEPLEFSILVTNSGDVGAENVSFTTTLPTGDELDWTIDPNTAIDACEIDGNILTCESVSLAALGVGSNQLNITVTSPGSYILDEAACADGYTARSMLTGAYSGESAATINLSSCDPATIPTITVVLAECIDWSVTESEVTVGEDGNGVTALVNPANPQDGTVAQAFVVTLTLDSGYTWPVAMDGWTVDGRTATQTFDADAATCPPRPVPVDLSISSSDPTAISVMPEGSTWTITGVDDHAINYSGTFTGDQLTLPAVVSLPEPLLPGRYLVEINATPAFDLFSEEFTVTGTEQSAAIGVMGMSTQPHSGGMVPLMAQQSPDTENFDILLQVAEDENGDDGSGNDGGDGTGDDGSGNDGGDGTGDDGSGDNGGDGTGDDGSGDNGEDGTGNDGDSDSGTGDDGDTAPDPDSGNGSGTDDGATPDPGPNDDGSDAGDSASGEEGSAVTPGSSSGTETQTSAGTDPVTGLPSTGVEQEQRTANSTLMLMTTAAVILMAAAATIRRR